MQWWPNGEFILTGVLSYRPEIQGLRPLAVLLVFRAHAQWMRFYGGFVGVDFFFVISGYVITVDLLKEHRRTQSLLLCHFYARRLQRLLPALVVIYLHRRPGAHRLCL
jgi:peptidoglycan/LPS O-acetylase OafA/YrhL